MILAIETCRYYADTALGYLWQAGMEAFPGELGLGATEADAVEDLFARIGELTEH